ncbi:Concanavalin A-like lectin/glucanase, subgroup [Artemisia annua]|uniref:Concanavalin A-like lectin/glucanase, subgroup n=1 Tax=Artemisia annua TaxID=35608 RepID=A0A2U1MU23_ARTAN|nr:Concanavalin A-like lectin/glucanase, subgroup [Artemisia annua]
MASLTKKFEHLEIKLEDIKLATDNFNEKNVIGKGGFGKVYKGELSQSSGKTKVAFKRLDSKFGQGGSEFVKEIKMLSCYTHKNLISLLGFCSQEDEMILVYEFAARGSLDNYLKDATLTWTQRIKIFLFEVLCGKLCFEYSNHRYKVLVPMWKKSYKENKLDEIIFPDLMQQMDPSSLKTFADIAYQCLQNSREQRPVMSHVVEKLKSALEWQEARDMTLKLPKEYAEIVKSAVDRLIFTSLKELEALLSKWVIINGGKTLFSINDKREHCERICIEGCLNLDEIKDGSLEYPSHYYNSRFPGGRCYEYKNEFKARVRADFLSPEITYTVNLVFRFINKSNLPKLMPIRYKLDGETKLITVYKTNQGEDGWFMAALHQCTSEHRSLEIMFERCQFSLLVAGIEFQPFKEKVEDDEVLEYQDIIKAASHSLAYRSLAELKVLLSKGIHLNEYKRWFSLNEKGDNCEMISVAECLIPDESNKDHVFHYEPAFHYEPRYLSR